MSKTPPWCSVIIPTLNEAPALGACLRALSSGAPVEDIEIIVADGGSKDDTRNVAQTHGATTLLCTCGRARQMNAGARRARGEWLWFLHADTLPPPDWYTQLKTAARRSLPASFCLRFDRQEANWWLRTFARGSHWDVDAFRFGDQSLFVSRADFRATGGYDEGLALLEGHEMVRRLRRHCGGFQLLPADVTTSARRYLQYGVVYTQSVFVLIFCLYYLWVPQRLLLRLYATAFR